MPRKRTPKWAGQPDGGCYIPIAPNPEHRERVMKIWQEAAQNLGGFLRVRGSAVGDPLHEFDIPVSLYQRHPDRYTVIEADPRVASRPMKAVAGVNAPDITTDAPSEGDPEKENEHGI